MKQILAFIFLLAGTLHGLAQEEHYLTLIDSANEAYASKDYQKALDFYSEVENFGYFSSQLYYNKANTLYRMNELPQAILYFERALLLDPTNDDIAYNLEVCNQQIPDNIETLPTFFLNRWIAELANIFYVDTWAVVSIIFVLIAAISLFILIRSKSLETKKWSLIGSFISGGLFVIALGFAQFTFKQNTQQSFAIVFAESVDINAEPNENSTVLYVVHEGLKVNIIKQDGAWMRVKLPNGNIGWMLADRVEVI